MQLDWNDAGLGKSLTESRNYANMSGKGEPYTESLHSLMRDYEQVVIEGGDSPAEINLRPSDSGRQTSLPLLSSATDRQIACHLVISWGACPPSETSYNCAFS